MTVAEELPEVQKTYARGKNPISLSKLSPPFTPETAAAAARNATRSRIVNANRAPDDALQVERVKKQVGRVLWAMQRTKVSDVETYVKLSGILDKLWTKAYPTQAAQKSKPKAGQSQAQPLPSDPIQEPDAAQEL